MTAKKHVLLIGGYAAGKTSYLGRIWIEIDYGLCNFKLKERPQTEKYLIDISNHLLKGKFPPRTDQTNELTMGGCSIAISHASSEFNLVAPDLAGEDWERLYENREWQLESMIDENCVSCCLIRADRIRPMLSFHTHGRTYSSSAELRDDVSSNEAAKPASELFLVEWLQMLKRCFNRRLGRKFAPKVAIVLTAWDAIPFDLQPDPEQFIHRDMPLLSQFIQNNSMDFEFGIFGFSSTGVDVKQMTSHSSECTEESCPHGFAYCKLDGKYMRKNSVLAPLYWALE
ncbi:MAG TPA: hypothetical protein V6C81_09630 [Planktothrix sp.]|jgi:hypothetical protein